MKSISNRDKYLKMNALPLTDQDQSYLSLSFKTTIYLRWIAILGQGTALLFAIYLVDLGLPALLCWGLILSAVVVNFIAYAYQNDEREGVLCAFLSFDVLQLAGLLFATGGLSNPFCFFIMAPVAIAAALLKKRQLVFIVIMALCFITALSQWSLNFPWQSSGIESFPPLFHWGIWASLCLSLIFIAGLIYRLSSEMRKSYMANFALEQSLNQENQDASLGALATAAMHELGSPLGTIALIAKDLEEQFDGQAGSDISLLQSEVERCRGILNDIARNPKAHRKNETSFDYLPISAMIDFAIEQYRKQDIDFILQMDETVEEPWLIMRPEIKHGLGNLIQNAMTYAKSEIYVFIDYSADGEGLSIIIEDDGVGFPLALLERIGEPYLSAHENKKKGMGLGIYIAKKLLEKTGASLIFDNREDLPGAMVEISWSQDILLENGLLKSGS